MRVFGAVLALLVVVAGFSLLKLNDANAAGRQVADVDLAAVDVTRDAQVAILTTQRELRQSVLVSSDADKVKSQAAITAADAQFSRDTAELNSFCTRRARPSWRRCRRPTRTRAPLRAKLLSLSAAKQADAATAVLHPAPKT